MDEFKIKLSRVRNAVQEQNNIAKQMRRLEDEVRKAYNRLDFEVAQKREVKKRLQAAGDDISAEYNSLYKAARALGNIANAYERADLKLVGKKPKKGTITPVTAAGIVLGGMFGPPFTIFLLTGGGYDLIKGPLKTLFDDAETESGWKAGVSNPFDWSENQKEKSKWSHNKKNLGDSEIDPAVKFFDYHKGGSKSLFSDENLVGDEEGTHVKTNFDIAKGEANLDVYGGLYGIDPKTGKKVIRAALGAEMGVAFSGIAMSEEMQWGDKNWGAYAGSTQTLGRAELNGDAVIGLRDAEGDINPTIHGSASAEAIGAEMTAKGGLKIGGTDIGVEGSVNYGIGGHAEFGLKDGKFSADIGVSFGLGVGFGLELDMTGTVEAIVDKAEAVWPQM